MAPKWCRAPGALRRIGQNRPINPHGVEADSGILHYPFPRRQHKVELGHASWCLHICQPIGQCRTAAKGAQCVVNGECHHNPYPLKLRLVPRCDWCRVATGAALLMGQLCTSRARCQHLTRLIGVTVCNARHAGITSTPTHARPRSKFCACTNSVHGGAWGCMGVHGGAWGVGQRQVGGKFPGCLHACPTPCATSNFPHSSSSPHSFPGRGG